MITWLNKRAGGDGGMTLLFHAGRVHPAAPQHGARTPDGQFICLLADGSVQQISRSRYEQMFQNSGQPRRVYCCGAGRIETCN